MQFNTIIPKRLKQHYQQELDGYYNALEQHSYDTAWHYLERAHILGQSYPFEHTFSHWLMLKFGLRQKNFKEVIGQFLRLVVGGWKSFIDHVPTGNTGGSDVPPLRRMELPDDLEQILIQYHN